MNNIYHLHEKNISQKIIFNSKKKNTFFFFFAKTLKNKISLSYHHLFINLKKQKQPNKKLYYQKCWEIKIEKKNKIINNNNNKTTTKPPTLLFTTINNLKKPKQKKRELIIDSFRATHMF